MRIQAQTAPARFERLQNPSLMLLPATSHVSAEATEGMKACEGHRMDGSR